MTGRRGERVAPPPAKGEWDLIFGTNEAAKGWEDLCAQAPGNTHAAWRTMRTDPQPAQATPRHHRLKGSLAFGQFRGSSWLPQWQIEVTGAGRVWYLADQPRRRVILMAASTGHPKATEGGAR